MTFPQNPNIENNQRLRIPQREGWRAIWDHYQTEHPNREIGIVLPVGCGKSGLIAISPFATNAQKVLVIAPNLRIRDQLGNDLRAGSQSNFYERCEVISRDEQFPDAAIAESGRINIDDFNHSDVVVANIQQISGTENRWLDQLNNDFFDLILVDEAHHNTAMSWQIIKERFPNARIVNFSATPTRADGRLMEGQIVYSFPILRAIEAGYVKRLRAKMLRPSELRYIDPSDGVERVIGPDEVRAMGENEAAFRRGIVMSPETLGSIVDCAIGELRRLRTETGENRLKIIASALNQAHCIQITEAFRSRGYRADYVHSREGRANQAVFQRLDNHEIDVIVQAKMLGEGFDHPYLAVAMVASIYANLGPFVQFVGRVMRAIEQNAPGHPLNQGVVVFHAGANVASRWEDFRNFSGADQEYFSQLLPEAEEVDFGDLDTADREPGAGGGVLPIDVLEETDVRATDLAPIGDPVALNLLRQLAESGITPEQAAHEIRRFRGDRQSVREARRASLNDRIQHEAGSILQQLDISQMGRTLDRSRRVNNFAWVTSELNRRINQRVGGENNDRQNFTLDQINTAHEAVPEIVEVLIAEIRSGS